MIFLIFSFIFTILYRPLKTHESLNLSYAATMAIYILSWAVSIYLLIRVIKAVPFFSAKKEWTFSKDIISILFVLAATGITSYIMGFVMEEPSVRWNMRTFLDSCKYALFIGIIPFGFFTLINYRHLFDEEVSQEFGSQLAETAATAEDKIQIISRLKKEELSFFPHQFLYAESEGNYVKFYLDDKERIRTELIRNSITEIERQLSGISYFSRIHRAFIVNVKMIRSKKGNTLGY
ncbi:MAG TPA: LytTR family DNA-binding domain-containing protein, partial [Bacteroidales bacterium]|nr:LytTR family DNA-binding domain-containing protein [Bacteroidales bacterium]